jgi:membrane protein implicated in regulation of membrane protease activity
MWWHGNALLVIVGALMVLLEVMLGGFAGFDLVLVGSSLVAGGLVGLATGSTSVGFAVAGVLAVVYIAIGRRWMRARMHSRRVPSNVDALVGRPALVMLRIAEHEAGQVKVGDEVWRAAPARGVPGPFDPGSTVTVEGIDGVTLLVR